MPKLTELERDRLPLLEKREENREKGLKMSAKVEDDCNAKLRKLNIAIQAGLTTRSQMKPAAKKAPAAKDVLK